MKKLLTIILTFSFLFTIVGGAFADTTPTQDPTGTTTPATIDTTTPPTIDTTTPPAIDTTTPTATPEIVDLDILTGTLKAINFAEKKFTIAYSKDATKDFTYSDNSFVLNGVAVTPESIPLDSKLVVKYLIYSDKSEKVVKVQVANLEVKAYPGTVSAISTDGTIKVTFANKKSSKVFTYDADTKFEYKGLLISSAQIVVGSKVVVKYQKLADNSLKVVKVQVVQLPKQKKDHRDNKDNKGHNKGKNVKMKIKVRK